MSSTTTDENDNQTGSQSTATTPVGDPNLFKLNQGDSVYSSDESVGGIHKFGLDYAHSDYVIPVVRITFYDPNGIQRTVPPIYIRLGGAFQSVLNQGYSDAQGVFGNPNAAGAIFQGAAGEAVGKFGDSLLSALQRQLVAGMAGTTGYLASAGQTGRAQIEFLTRKFLNNFQQVVYQGPRYRPFNLPFSMKPTSQKEAKTMIEIIHNLRLASLPRTGASDSDAVIDDFRNFNQEQQKFLIESTGPDINDKTKYPKGKDDPQYQEDLNLFKLNNAEYLEPDQFNGVVRGAPLVFTYPDMIKFEIILYEGGTALFTMFKSDYCAIENISLDYGSSAKMTFFATDDKTRPYIPTEVNMQLSLKEMTLVTGGYQTSSWLASHVIF